MGLSCSFCYKPRSDVRKIVAGPNVYICDVCVAQCDEILIEEGVDIRGEEYSKHRMVVHHTGREEPSVPHPNGGALAFVLLEVIRMFETIEDEFARRQGLLRIYQTNVRLSEIAGDDLTDSFADDLRESLQSFAEKEGGITISDEEFEAAASL